MAKSGDEHKRIPVALPHRPDGGGGHLMATHFRIPNDVAVTMYQNPALDAISKVYLAVVFACL